MSSNEMNEASSYFNANWQKYKQAVNNNMLFHREMFMTLSHFLDEHMSGDFTLVDVGCGDSSSIAPALIDKSIKKYIGIDAAEDVLKLSASTLDFLNCDKEFISEDMTTAVKNLKNPVDVIFTSYAVHHLSTPKKIEFITDCHNKLNPNGFLLMVDGVLEQNQTRKEWLKALERRYQVACPDMPHEEITNRMQHPSESDFPDEISTFEKIAKKMEWKGFQVILDKGIFAFMVFSK